MIGVGKGGKAILSSLIKTPGIEVKYVCDTNKDAQGIELAKKYNIPCFLDDWEEKIKNDPDIDLIFEATGKLSIFHKLNEIKAKDTVLIAASGTRIVFDLIETQVQVSQRLEEYKKNLEIRIIERTEDLEKANNELMLQIIEHEKLNEQLQVINDEKTKYLLQATHQLKAPFAAIQSYTDIILAGYTGGVSEQTSKIMQKIKTRCNLLSTSIKEMLELANLKSCIKDNLKMDLCSLNSLIESVVEPFIVLAEKRNIRLEVEFLKNDIQVECNKDQVLILFSILVDNAINYSFDNSKIEIYLSGLRSNRFSISIQDYGIGVSEKNLNKIFNEYFRSNEAVSKHENGTGLGLAIAKEIANINKFNIVVESTIKKGSTFFITGPTVKK